MLAIVLVKSIVNKSKHKANIKNQIEKQKN